MHYSKKYFAILVTLATLAPIMALVYQPTKLDKRVIEAAEKAVRDKKFKSKNSAYNEGLKKYFGIKDEKEAKK